MAETESDSQVADYIFKDNEKPAKVESPEEAKRMGLLQTAIIFVLLVIAIIAVWWIAKTYLGIKMPI